MSTDIQDTRKIQIASLKRFMDELLYDYSYRHNCFMSFAGENKTRSTVSVNTAIKLHNDNPIGYNRDDGFYSHFVFPYQWIKNAREAKIVEVVKLQSSYKKGIIVQDHRVTFCKPEYSDLFIKNKD